MQFSFISCLLLISVLNIEKTIANEDRPVVVTSVGTIRGVRASDGNYSMFMGIPYGKVNESNPFGIATPYPRFDDVYDAIDDTKACPQMEEINNNFIGTLDCLDINIYVPDSVSIEKPAAVMVYIYGGIFNIGFASRYMQGPKFLVRHDVILVTLNYRLGPYGFMCLHTPEIPGNQGLRDQLLALRWIRDNIAAFGGDLNKVFLFGISAGTMSIDLLMWSEQEKLFNGIILQSGNAFTVQWRTESDTNNVLALAEQLGLRTSNIDEAISFLARLDPSTVIQGVSEIPTPSALQPLFEPCVEKKIDGVGRIIANNAVNLELPKLDGLKVMVGFADDEMMPLFALTPEPLYPALYQNYFRDNLQSMFDFDNETLVAVERMVRNFYIGDDIISVEKRNGLANFASDTTFVYSTERTLARYLANDVEAYYYVFSYDGGRNLLKSSIGATIGGAYHADEVGYLFDIEYYDEPTPEDQLIIDRMTTMWTNFAKYGDPTPETSALLPVKWEPITKGSVYHYLNITTDIAAGRRPFHQRMTFWDLFYQKYGQYEKTFKKPENVSSAAISLYSPFYFLLALIRIVFILIVN